MGWSSTCKITGLCVVDPCSLLCLKLLMISLQNVKHRKNILGMENDHFLHEHVEIKECRDMQIKTDNVEK
jgi:hypothetical protein